MEAELINRIVELDIDMEGFDDSELEELGVDVISLVEEPAIGIDFQYRSLTFHWFSDIFSDIRIHVRK